MVGKLCCACVCVGDRSGVIMRLLAFDLMELSLVGVQEKRWTDEKSQADMYLYLGL